jgi:hypothetical protein
MTVRVHAVVDPAIQNNPVRTAELRDLVINRFHLQNFNDARYRLFGILTGDVDSTVIDDMRRVEGFTSVSVDAAVYAI